MRICPGMYIFNIGPRRYWRRFGSGRYSRNASRWLDERLTWCPLFGEVLSQVRAQAWEDLSTPSCSLVIALGMHTVTCSRQCQLGTAFVLCFNAMYKCSNLYYQPTTKIVTYIHSVAHCLVSNTSPDQLTSPQGPPRTSRLPRIPPLGPAKHPAQDSHRPLPAWVLRSPPARINLG